MFKNPSQGQCANWRFLIWGIGPAVAGSNFVLCASDFTEDANLTYSTYFQCAIPGHEGTNSETAPVILSGEVFRCDPAS